MPRVKPRVAQPQPLPDRPGRWKMLLRRQRKLLRPTMLSSATIIVLIAAVFMAHTLSQGASMRAMLGDATADLGLTIQSVTIEGREKTPQAVLNAALDITPGDPIFSYSVAAARLRVETIPWVRAAIVERVLPNTIHVVLTERHPFALWQNQGKFTLIDQAGNIVTDSNVADFRDTLPLVVGLGAPMAAAPLLNAISKYPEVASRMLAAIRVGERRWNLCLSSGATVQLPEGAEIQALARLVELQASKALLDRPLQEIDLRLPDRMRLRPMADGPCGEAGQHASTPGLIQAVLPRKPV